MRKRIAILECLKDELEKNPETGNQFFFRMHRDDYDSASPENRRAWMSRFHHVGTSLGMSLKLRCKSGGIEITIID